MAGLLRPEDLNEISSEARDGQNGGRAAGKKDKAETAGGFARSVYVARDTS